MVVHREFCTAILGPSGSRHKCEHTNGIALIYIGFLYLYTPCAMVLRLISRSPRCAGLDSHRHSQIIIRELDPSVGGPGPHDFAVRISRARLAQRTRPSHPAPNVRDDRETPLLWERDARSNTRFPIFVNRNFRAGEPEGPDQLEATREFSFFAQAILVA
jgi:hypothetical protein